MGECSGCSYWIVQRKTLYGDGSEIINYEAPSGKGHCDKLNLDTDPEFGCKHFEVGYEHYEILAKKTGSPWQHSQWGKCPDCNGKGSSIEAGVCGRCCGTARVLYYDDGYIGEERFRIHPNQKKDSQGRAEHALKCPSCAKDISQEWVGCPFCGHRLIEAGWKSAKTESLGTGAGQ